LSNLFAFPQFLLNDLFSDGKMPLSPLTLVLDIDETLVHSWQDPLFVKDLEIYTKHFAKFYPPGQDPICYSFSTERDDLEVWGLIRPHYREFIEYVTKTFDTIVIWSAGSDDYVRMVVKILFHSSKLFSYPKIIHCRTNCARDRKGFYHKPLRHLHTFLKENRLNLEIDLKRTLILDDKEYTFIDNPHYGIQIPPFHPDRGRGSNGAKGDDEQEEITLKMLLNRSDRALLQFIEWAEKMHLRDLPDLGEALPKKNIFA
jgi:TFIIF-interacting CTD phosphatase-like protein